MKLITEEIESVEVLTETVNGKKSLYITGPFLQTECTNRNNRRYSYNIVEKEVKRYTDRYIKEGRALGELGHPCLSGDAKLLSVHNGWKHIQDCSEGELVYTMNPDSKEIEIQPIKKVVINHHKGVMFTLKNRGIETKITPDHRFLIINSRNHNQYKYVTAQEIYNDLNGENTLSKWYIPKYSLGLNQESPEYYVIPKSNSLKVINDKTKKYLNDLKIEFNTFAAFLGIYLSEGYVTKTPKGSFNIGICQNEGHKADKMSEILHSMSEELVWNESFYENKVIWTCYDRRLGEYLEQFGKCYDKFVPKDFISQLNSENARTFIDYFVLGDGRGSLSSKYQRCDAFSTSKQLMDDIAQVAVIAGIGISFSEEICEFDYIFAGRIIKAENKSPIYFCYFLNSKGVYLDNRFMQMTSEEWDDNVYCIQVENTNFMVEQNGYNYWTGNCGPSINLDRAAIKIVSLVPEGKNFIGKAKILESTPMGKITKALIDEGVRLGVSSRGLGSTRQHPSGYIEVCDDFMLATAADVVHDPSAPDAYVSSVMENAEWIYDAVKDEWIMERTKKKIESLVDQKILEEYKLSLFNEFLNSL